MTTSYAIYGSLVAGLATGLGALPIYFKKDFSKNSLDIGLGFSAGIMLVASFTALILPSISEAKSIYGFFWGLPWVLISLMLGYFFIILVHDFYPMSIYLKKQI